MKGVCKSLTFIAAGEEGTEGSVSADMGVEPSRARQMEWSREHPGSLAFGLGPIWPRTGYRTSSLLAMHFGKESCGFPTTAILLFCCKSIPNWYASKITKMAAKHEPGIYFAHLRLMVVPCYIYISSGYCGSCWRGKRGAKPK